MSADTDRDLLFGVLAVQAGILDADRFAEACSGWAARNEKPLADLLVERGLLTAEDRSLLLALLARNIEKHAGDARASLAAVAAEPVRQTLGGCDDPVIREAMGGFPTLGGGDLDFTVDYGPASRDRYTLTRLHATGGIGQVWLARDDALGREVALKELRPGKGNYPGALARFLDEAKITGQLQHPSIVPVYELSLRGEGQTPYYTMRFVRGRTLCEAINAFHRERQAGVVGPLALRELLSAFVGICNAVAYAHSRGVIHRDLKPANVVLGDYGEVVLLDWGLAKAETTRDRPASRDPVAAQPEGARGETVQDEVMGTPAYMAPEQAEGRLDIVDERSDVYGLGAVLYTILTGEPPFPGSDPQEVLRQVVKEAPVPPRRRVAQTPPALEAVCLKALEKRPANRYASARELAGEVQHFLADEPVSAYPEPPAARAGRWVRKHRTGVTAAAAALAVVAVGLLVTTSLLTAAYRQAEVQRDHARAQRDRARDYLGMARDAVQQYQTSVSESPELRAHGLEKLRGKLLRGAVSFYEEFARADDQDPSIMAERGRAFYRLGAVRNDMGQLEEAESAYRGGLALFAALAAGHPGDQAYRLELARGHDGLGRVFVDNGKGEQAEKEHLEEAAICRSLLAAQPEAPAYRFQLGRAYRGLAEAHYVQQHYQAMRQAAEQAVPHLRAVAVSSPAAPEYQWELGRALELAGSAAGETGESKPALKSLGEAVAVYRSLVAAHPDAPEFQDHLAQALTALARVHANNLRQPDEALRIEKEAVDVSQRLVRDHPDMPLYRFRLALLWNNMGVGNQSSGRLQEAKQCLANADAFFSELTQQYPANERYRDYSFNCKVVLALETMLTGDYASAVEQTEKLLQGKPRHEVTWYNAACVYSQAVPLVRQDVKLSAAQQLALARQYAQRAVELLREASARGFADMELLRKDSDLTPLSDREDFKRLLRELERKQGQK
jgi:eukaryotic-like serine/threonine-protein kinase